MRVIKLLQQGGSENIDIPNTLEALQKEVGGYIETLTLAPGVVMIVDEEGRLKDKPCNGKASDICGMSIVGDALIVGHKGDEFCDIPQPIVTMLANLFGIRGGNYNELE